MPRRSCSCATSRAPPATRALLLLVTFRDTEADVPEALSQTLADLRRSDDVVRLRLAGLSDDDVGEFVRHAAEGDAGSGPPGLARAIGELTERQRVPRLRAVARPGGDRHRRGRRRHDPAHPAAGGARHTRERPRGRQPAALAPGAGHDRPAGARGHRGVGVRGRSRSAQASGLGEPELLAALDEAVRSGMIEELPSRRLAYRFTHELVRRALYDRLSGVRRAELHLRVGEALERSEGRSGRVLADLAHHFAAAAPLGRPRTGASSTTCRAARAATAAVAFDEAATRLRTALELGIDSPATRAEVLPRARHRQPPRGRRERRAGGVPGDGGASPASSANAELLARAAIGFEEACWRPGIADQGAVELLEEATTALGEDDSELRVGTAQRARARARLPGRARARGHRAHRCRGPGPRAARPRPALATTLVRSYWSRGTSSLDEILAMLTEAMRSRPRSWATPRSSPRRWRGGSRPSSRWATSSRARREVAALLATAEQTAQPFMLHVAEHYGSSDRALRRAPRRGRGEGAALARVEPAADRARRRRRLRDPDVQHPPRAGTAGRAARR